MRAALALAALAAGCGGTGADKGAPDAGTDKGGPDAGTEQPVVAAPLFADDFSAGFPGTQWIVWGTRPPALDSSRGNAAPAVSFDTTADAETLPGMRSTVALSAPFEISLELALLAGAGAEIEIKAVPRTGACGGCPNSRAEVVLGATSDAFRFFSYSLTGGVNASASVPRALDGQYHRYTYTVDASGTATWSRDGVEALRQSDFGTGGVIWVTAGATGAQFLVDNVRALKP